MKQHSTLPQVCTGWLTNLRKSFSKGVILTMMLFLCAYVNTSAQLPCNPAVGMEIDGNPCDWNNAHFNTFTVKSYVGDPFGNGTVDNQFVSSKDFFFADGTGSGFLQWSYGQTKAKNDIANAAAVLQNNILYFAGDRTSNNGDAQIGFWFYLNGTAPRALNATGGDFAPAHVRGDLLILADFTGGGRNGAVNVYRWVGGGSLTPGSSYVVGSNNNLETTNVVGTVAENNDLAYPHPDGWSFINPTYETNEFYEGRVDLTGLVTNSCFASFLLEARSSQSITASLDDYAAGTFNARPIPLVLTGSLGCGVTTGNITSTTSELGVTYQLYNSANTAVQATKAGTGSGLTWTGVPIGTGYYVIGTNAVPCSGTSNAVDVTSNTAVITSAGPDQTVCASSATVTLAGSVTGGSSTGTWSGGAGAFGPGNTTLNATYTPTGGEIAAGTVTLTLTSGDPAGPCPATNDQVTITINPVATANANVDQTVCASSPNVTLAGSVGGGASSGTWSTSGTGTFSPNATTLTGTYIPSAADITAGTVTLTLTSNDPTGPCAAASDNMIVTINPAATSNANVDQTVCASSPNVTLAGSVGGGASSGTWSTSGTGTFSPNATTLTGTYIPSAADITAGTVTLTLTTNDPAGPCPAVSDNMVVTINPAATANANVDQTVCASSPNVTLAGSVGGGASSGTWSTNGTGTFSPNATTLGATYIPSAADITAGAVTLTLTTNDPTGPCPAVSDAMIVTINPAATSNANVDQTVCASSPNVTLNGSIGGGASSGTWSTSGTGTFSPNATTLGATYIPSAADITAGTVTLTLTTDNPAGPCPAVSDAMIVTINPAATSNANVDQTVCASSPNVTLAGSVGGGASSGTWSTSGTGTFSPNATTLTGTYIPSAADITAGTVTLTLTTNDPTGPCPAVSDAMIVTINPAATSNANVDQTVCASSPNVTLAGSVGGGASSGTWSTSGTGTFSPNATTLNATYIPSAADKTAGTVTLTLTTNDPTGPCPAVSDAMIVTINPAATANANVDQTVCASSPNVTLAGSVGGGASSGTWSTSGTGTFSPNATTLGATYIPSAADITAGTVTLTLTTNDPTGPCPAVSDAMIVTINPAATANANVDQTVCASSPNVTLNGSVGGGASTGTWSTSGTGTFSPNATTLTGTYIPSAADITAGTVTLTLTSNDPTGPCAAASDNMIVTINPAATSNANVDQTVCASSPNVTLNGSVGGGASSGTWSTSGTGTFSPNATTLGATYIPSAADKTAGTVTLTLTTNDPAGPCPAVSDNMVVTINPAATSNANVDQTVCASSPNVTLAGSVGGGASSGTWSTSGTGTFSPNATTLTGTYIPSAADITAGTVTLTLTTNDPTGPCPAVSDAMIVTINPAATSNANVDQTVCASSPNVTLNGSVGGGASSGTWSTSGTGTFSPNATTLGATYIPSAADITAGTVTLTLTTNDPTGPCPAVSDAMIVTINAVVVTYAGPDQTLPCPRTNNNVQLAGTVTGGATTGTWSGGDGTFAPNANALDAIYTPGPGDIALNSVTLTLTSADPTGPCGATSDQVTIGLPVCLPPPAAQCTYTQGYYGNAGGKSCDGTTGGFTTIQLIQQSITNWGGTITIGHTGHSVVVPYANASCVIDKLPGGGGSKELGAGDPNICSIPEIKNTLLAQTLTLALNVGITTTHKLGDFELKAGDLYTAKSTTGCGGQIPILRTCKYDVLGHFIGYNNDYKKVTIDAAVVNAIVAIGGKKTVQGLLNLANNALANTDGTVGTENGVSISSIAAVADAINNAFDECRVPVSIANETPCPTTGTYTPRIGYSDVKGEATNVTTTSTSVTTATSGANISMSSPKGLIRDALNLAVAAFPNPYNDRVVFTIQSDVSGHGVLEVYNLKGQKLQTVFDGNVFAGKSQTVQFNVPVQNRTTLMYRLTVGGKQVSGKLIRP